MPFAQNFVWGAAAASYQVEGAVCEDGKGMSVWDMMCSKPGAIWEGQRGDIACDHYHRFKEDVAIMREIGLKGYRFSISWPRVLPDGVGKVNTKGLDFYNKLVDELIANQITPYVTLFHWDYPYELYCRGGWLNAESSDWFAQYTGIIAEALSDRVTDWMTLNEPQCFIGQGHMDALHAPGDKLNFREMLRAGHNALLAHGKAVQVLRAKCKSKPNIGYAPVGVTKVPASPKTADIEAARMAMFAVNEKHYWNTAWWTDPVFLGKYPDDALELFGNDAPLIKQGDMKTISEPLDFCGANIYNGRETVMGPDGKPADAPRDPGYAMTSFGWPIVPESLYWGPKFLYERYRKPIVITENGMADLDWVSLDGKIHDHKRIDFLHRYLLQLQKASDDGVDVRGYFQWSLTDNFEWAQGFSKRFGLVFVDYPTQKRILKDSANWYKAVIATNGKILQIS